VIDETAEFPVLQELDKVIHERTRLWIVAILASRKEVGFVSLKKLLNLGDGKLNTHLNVLEDNGYIKSKKAFVKRKPRTSYRLTSKGQASFKAYINQMEKVVQHFSE